MYLDDVKKRLLKGPAADLKLEICRSVVVSMDVADALLKDAENSEDAEGMHTLGSCDLIAIATHGRGGLQRLAMGSVTWRLLGATKLPLLIVRRVPGGIDMQQKQQRTTKSELIEVE